MAQQIEQQLKPQAKLEDRAFNAFKNVAEKIQSGADSLGLTAPYFKTPPGISGHTRTLKRTDDEQWIVSVEIKERLTSVVIADMIEGVCAANSLDEKLAGEIRSHLWKSATTETGLLAADAAQPQMVG